jgi:hypothetical protein
MYLAKKRFQIEHAANKSVQVRDLSCKVLQSSAKFSSKSAANTEEITDFGSKMLQIPWK